MNYEDITEIIEKLNRLNNRLSKIETKMEDKLENGLSKILEDHEKRIRTLERFIWMGLGALALLQAILKLIPLPWGGQ